jgi:hypothetical protein
MRSMPAAVALALLAAGAISTARAGSDEVSLEPNSDRIHVGSGVICDTQDEVTSFVRLMSESDASGAMQRVNREAATPMACGMATVAFRTGKHIGEVHTDKGTYNIMEIEIVAGSVNGNWQMVPRRTQYTAVPVAGYDI